MPLPKDLSGKRFGKLTCLEIVPKRRPGERVRWLCVCDCGKKSIVYANNFERGNTTSCGCESSRIKRRTHGRSDTRLYKVWSSMKTRCSNPKDRAFPIYGGKGVSVCEEWSTFEPFFVWAINSGYRQGLTIERIDSNGNYCPENCTWITKSEQSNNTSRCKIIEHDGKRMILKKWAEHLNIPYSLLQCRLKRGWSFVKAITVPSGSIRTNPKTRIIEAR